MIHRLLFIIAGLLLMFAVMTAVMMVGSSYDPNAESMTGYVTMLSILVVAMVVFFRLGTRVRRRLQQRFDDVLSRHFSQSGSIEASTFASETDISLDSARDVLDTMARRRGWRCVEGVQYDAWYYPS